MKKKLLFVAIVTIIFLILIGLRRNSAPLFSVKECQCYQVQDAFLSDTYFSSINNVLSDLCQQQCGAQIIIDSLKEQFPVLDTITISYKPVGMRVTLLADEPICTLNDSHVFTSQHKIFPQHFFSVDVLADIPAIEVMQNDLDLVLGDVSSLLQGLSSDVYQGYKVELNNEHCLHLIDKQQPDFMIISSVAQVQSKKLLAQCKRIKETIDDKKGFDKGVKWVADTRFAHYIVAYKA